MEDEEVVGRTNHKSKEEAVGEMRRGHGVNELDKHNIYIIKLDNMGTMEDEELGWTNIDEAIEFLRET